MLVWAALGMALVPFLTVLSTNLYYLTIVNALSGFFISGVVLLLFNLLLEQSPSETRTYCITSYNVLLSFVAFIAPQVGIILLEGLGIQKSMELNSILRIGSAFVFLLMYSRTKKYTKAVLLKN